MAQKHWILHLDLDAFFAAVEQRDKPSLRGKPVVVGGIGNRGVVATASYEARAYGIRSAMNTSEARRRCGHAAFLSGRFEAYSRESRTVMDVLRTLSTDIEPLSLDEAYVDLGTQKRTKTELQEIAHRLHADIHSATGGLTASIGIAPNKLLAKIGSELNKPHGHYITMPGEEIDVLSPLSVRALPGVGPAAEAKLHHVGISKVAHVYHFTQAELQEILGESAGAALFMMAQGIDHRQVEPNRARKSISIEDTFAHDLHENELIRSELLTLIDRLVARMSRQGLSGRTISVKLRDSTFHTTTKSTTIETATHSSVVISAAAVNLLDAFTPQGGVRLLGVGVSGLSPWIQGDLFDQESDVETTTFDTAAETSPIITPSVPDWLTGTDVHHERYGDGWVWGSGLARVTVRFETRHTPPGPIHTFMTNDPELHLGHSDTVIT